MEIFRTKSINEAVERVDACLNTRSECAVVYSGDAPCVLRGRAPMYRRDLCRERKIPVGRSVYIGGVIVCGAGDLSVCLVTQDKTDFAPQAVRLLGEFYVTRGLSVSYDRNDVLVDGKKVTSWSRTRCNNMWQSVLHVSIHTDLDLIRVICTKPMIKVPGALGEYGVTTEECWQTIMPALLG